MNSYFDILALPNTEIIQADIIAALMQKLHLILPEFAGKIAVDFPAYGQGGTLGGIIRLLGQKQDIEKLYLQISKFNLFKDYALMKDVNEIPTNINKFVRYQRFHTGGGNSRLRRLEKRHKERGTWTPELEEAAKKEYAKQITLPHLKLKSYSSNKEFLLFIKEYKTDKLSEGKFNAYGLSLGEAAIPKF